MPHLAPFRWTSLPTVNPKDQQTADVALLHLREALAPIVITTEPSKTAMNPFCPMCSNRTIISPARGGGSKAAFRFNPAQRTSLLYRKTPDGYELEGAMFTAPNRAQ